MRKLLLLLGLPILLSGDPIRMMVDNHEEELRSFEERLNNQESIMDSIRSTLQESYQQQKTQFNTSLNNQDKQIKSLQDRQSELERKIQQQSQQISLLQDALKTFVDSFNSPVTSNTASESSRYYVVKNGDSLGKIARNHHTTSQVLREMNQLSGDKIIIGQKLKVPE